jgi:hypothetical protein
VAFSAPPLGKLAKWAKPLNKSDDAVDFATKGVNPDFIVLSKGTALPTNKDFNLVDSMKPGDWFQIHNKHTDAKAPGISHTHFPERHQQRTMNRPEFVGGSQV